MEVYGIGYKGREYPIPYTLYLNGNPGQVDYSNEAPAIQPFRVLVFLWPPHPPECSRAHLRGVRNKAVAMNCDVGSLEISHITELFLGLVFFQVLKTSEDYAIADYFYKFSAISG